MTSTPSDEFRATATSDKLSEAPSRRWRHAASALFLVVFATVPFLTSLDGDFLYDDVPYIQSNPQIRSTDWKLVFTRSLPPAQPELGLYRPLPVLTYRWQGGPGLTQDPSSYKALNVALHALVSILVWMTALSMGLSPIASFIAGVLFSLHPVHTESVSWIVGRAELMAAMFCLLSWQAHLRISRSIVAWPLCGALVFAGALCKESAMAFPAMLVMASWLKTRRLRPVLVESAVYAGFLVLLIVIRVQVLGRFSPDAVGSPFQPESFTDRLALSLDLFARYLEHLIAPYPLRIFYHRSEFGMPGLLGLLILTAFGAGLWWALKRKSHSTLLALLWLPLTLITVIHLVPIQETFAERFAYLPSVGICWLGGILLGHWATKERQAGGLFLSMGAVIAISVLFAALTFHRAPQFKNSVDLWEAAVRQSPQFPYSHYNLAIAYENAKIIMPEHAERRGALAEYQESLKIDPNHRFAAESHERIGTFYFDRRDYRSAVMAFRKAVQLNASLPQALLGLASCHQVLPEWVSKEEERFLLSQALPLIQDEGLRVRILQSLQEDGD